MNTALVIAVLVDSAVTLVVGLRLRKWAADSIETAAAQMQAKVAGEISDVSHKIVGEFVATMGGTLKDTVAPLLAQLIASRLEVSATGRVDVRPDTDDPAAKVSLRAVTEQ